MPRKNRGYKRGEPYRDSRLFVIACEGEKRERDYFYEIHKKSQRINVEVLVPKEGKSAPQWLPDRAATYTDEYGLSKEDFLWFVMDVDNWKKEQIDRIAEECEAKRNWHLAISNPCFEVWLFMHLKAISESKSVNCKELKNELHQLTAGRGYNPSEFILLMRQASERARQSETDENHYYPERMQSKVYRLADQILEVVGRKF